MSTIVESRDEPDVAPKRGRLTTAIWSALALFLVLEGFLVLWHAPQEVYAIPGYGVLIAVACFVVAGIGLGLSFRWGRLGLTMLYALSVWLMIVGFAAILSIGVLLLLVAVGLLIAALVRSAKGRGRVAAAAGGIMFGLGIAPLTFIAFSGPLVTCNKNGSSSGENIFLGFESNSGSSGGSTSADGRTETGTARGESYEYKYKCRDGKLVHFDVKRTG